MVIKPPKDPASNFLCTVKDRDSSTQKVPMQDGQYSNGTPHSFYFPAGHLQGSPFKGMRIIIQEYNARGAGFPDPVKLLAQCCDFNCPPGHTDCCCHWILFNQPDFTAQKSKLEELCEFHGYQLIFYPKFHCEVSFIEQCWGFAKWLYCEFPTSSSEADLERNVILASNAVPLESMQRCDFLICINT
jgi:hypothetical protein